MADRSGFPVDPVTVRWAIAARAIVSIIMTLAGVAAMWIGWQMISSTINADASQAVIKIFSGFEVTASGFGAVVMAAGVAIIFVAYLAGPRLNVSPTRLGATRDPRGLSPGLSDAAVGDRSGTMQLGETTAAS